MYTFAIFATLALTVHAAVKPAGFDRCDDYFCTGKTGDFAVSPCSKLYCTCNPTATPKSTWRGCPGSGATQTYYDGVSNTCKLPSTSPRFCPNGPFSTITPATWVTAPYPVRTTVLPDSYCNAANCQDRGSAYPFYTLDLCTPYWCYCWWNSTAVTNWAVQTCGAKQYFDFRPENVACVNATTLSWCAPDAASTTAAPGTTTTTVAPLTTTTTATVAPVTTTLSPTSTTAAPPTTAATVATTTATTTTASSTTDACAVPASPFSWSNPQTWRLTNGTLGSGTPSGAGSPTTVNVEVLNSLNTAAAGMQDYIVRKHNCLRSKVSATNMQKMVWYADAAAKAQVNANTCVYGHDSSAARATTQWPNGCGQNIATSSNLLPWEDIINLWYNEVNSFTYGQAPASGVDIGHYTQVIWASTYQVGCAFKYCPSGANTYIYVCNYCPAGNIGPIGSELTQYKPYIHGTSCAACSTSCANGKLCTNNCAVDNTYYNCASYSGNSSPLVPGACSDGSGICQAACSCAPQTYWTPGWN